jgi:hypothetical protein
MYCIVWLPSFCFSLFTRCRMSLITTAVSSENSSLIFALSGGNPPIAEYRNSVKLNPSGENWDEVNLFLKKTVTKSRLQRPNPKKNMVHGTLCRS